MVRQSFAPAVMKVLEGYSKSLYVELAPPAFICRAGIDSLRMRPASCSWLASSDPARAGNLVTAFGRAAGAAAQGRRAQLSHVEHGWATTMTGVGEAAFS